MKKKERISHGWREEMGLKSRLAPAREVKRTHKTKESLCDRWVVSIMFRINSFPFMHIGKRNKLFPNVNRWHGKGVAEWKVHEIEVKHFSEELLFMIIVLYAAHDGHTSIGYEQQHNVITTTKTKKKSIKHVFEFLFFFFFEKSSERVYAIYFSINASNSKTRQTLRVGTLFLMPKPKCLISSRLIQHSHNYTTEKTTLHSLSQFRALNISSPVNQ